MLTNREVQAKAKHLAGCLQGYIEAVDRLKPEFLDAPPKLHEPWYCGLVKEIGEFLAVMGNVNPE